MINPITTSNAVLAYQQQQSPLFTRSTDVNAADSDQKAKVVTKSFGLKIGKFGIDYTTRNVELPNEVEKQNIDLSGDSTSDQAKAGFSRYESFESFLEAASLRRQLHEDTANAVNDNATSRSGGGSSSLNKRLGLAAYANSIDSFNLDSRGGKSVLLAVA